MWYLRRESRGIVRFRLFFVSVELSILSSLRRLFVFMSKIWLIFRLFIVMLLMSVWCCVIRICFLSGFCWKRVLMCKWSCVLKLVVWILGWFICFRIWFSCFWFNVLFWIVIMFVGLILVLFWNWSWELFCCCFFWFIFMFWYCCLRVDICFCFIWFCLWW